MDDSKKLLWKAGIRNTAIKSKGEQIEKREVSNYDLDTLEKIYYDTYQISNDLKQYAMIQPHGAITGTGRRGKIKTFVKKVIRKFIEKFLGWYIFPIINQQVQYNLYCSEVLKNVDFILEYNKEQIQTLQKQVCELEALVEEGKRRI